MPISGLVVTLSRDPNDRQSALAALRAHPAIDVGEGVEHRVPIVVETADIGQDAQVWEWLHTLPGVVQVDVASVHFDEPARTKATPQKDQHP